MRLNEYLILITLMFPILHSSNIRCEEFPSDVLESVKQTVGHSSDGVKIEQAEVELQVSWHCQKFSIYGIDKGGVVSRMPIEVLGPTGDGFRFDIQFSRERYSGPQTYEGESRKLYWHSRRHEFKLKDDRGYVRCNFLYQTRTDMKVFSDVMVAISKYSERPFVETVEVGGRINGVLAELEERIRKMVETRKLNALFSRKRGELSVSYHVQDFTVYDVAEDGQVATTSRSVVGPLEDGFVINIRGACRSVNGAEFPSFGLVHHAYWSSYLNTFRANRSGDRLFHPFDNIRLEITYGFNTDRVILREIEAFLDEFGVPAIHGVFDR